MLEQDLKYLSCYIFPLLFTLHSDVFQRKLLAEQRSHWRKALLQALRDSRMILSSSNQRNWKISIYPFLCILPDEDYVNIMLQVRTSVVYPCEIFSLCFDDSICNETNRNDNNLKTPLAPT